MLDQIQTLSTIAQVSMLLLSLAVLLPLVGLVYGSARGLPLAQLGGVMIGYWVLALLSLVAAIALGSGASKSGMLLAVATASILLPLALKTASGLISHEVTKPPEPASSTTPEPSSRKCRPQLASAGVGNKGDFKIGQAGKLGWYFWIGNYYEWRLEYSIDADDSGATGNASATGKVSPWYSLKVRHRNVVASAKGSIDCEDSSDTCLSVAHPDSDFKLDGDFKASVEVRSSESGGRSVLEVACMAEVSGTPGLSGVSVGPSGVGVNLQAPNAAHDEIRKSTSYSYRCVRV